MLDHSRLSLQVTTPEDPVPKLIPKVSIGVAVTDAERRIIQANPVFCTFLGYSPHELIGMTVDDITHPEDLERTANTFGRLLSRQSTDHTYEKRYLRRDGTVVWSLTTVNRLENEADPASPMTIGFINDITRQKTTEQQLKATNDLYQGLVENVGVGLSLVDRDYRIKMVNSTLAGMFDRTPADFVGRRCHREFENKEDICPRCPGAQAMATGQPQMVETDGVRADGSRFKVRIKAFPYLEPDGSPGGFVELVEDLSRQHATELALEESERRFKTLADTAPIGIFEVDAEDRNTYANQALIHMTGLGPGESSGLGWLQAVPEDEVATVRQSWEHSRADGLPWQKEHRLFHRSGEERWVQTTATPVRNARGELLRWIGTVFDLTHHKRAMQQLSESEERFRAIYEQSGVGMNVATQDGRLLDANPAFCSFIGYSLQELKSMTVMDITAPEDIDLTRQMLQARSGPEGHCVYQKRFLRKDGRRVWGEVRAVLVPAGMAGRGFGVGIIHDITAKKEAQARLDYLDHHDELTGLPNRKLLMDRLEHAIAHAQRNRELIAVIVIGLDKFRKIFDHFDGETSNRLLCEVTRRLQSMTRQADTLARVGDTEMVVILENLPDREASGKVAQQILKAVAQPVSLGGKVWHLTASIGISLFPDQAESAESLLQSASGAMHHAKKQGGDTAEYVIPEMNVRARELMTLEMDLRTALDKQEFILFYQPQVELATGRVIGFEALIRWRHARKGLISPADFIPLAEETGMIVPIGEWAMKEACRQNMAWRRAGLPPVRMAVNISPRQFRRVDIPALVGRVLAETGHPAAHLELEITESMIMADRDRAIEIMKKLSALGVHLAIDDFGTGYSSLHSLKRFPVQRLKVDRSFVKDVTTDPNDAAIADAVVALAKAMHLEVVAEGIETEEQLAFFRQKGCDFCQGFLFSKPVAPDLAGAYLARNSAGEITSPDLRSGI